MNRKQLTEHIVNDLDVIDSMFENKNGTYGSDDNAFLNFHKSALIFFEESNPNTRFRMLMAFLSKHISALTKDGAIYNDKEFSERLMDMAVYALIGRAMKTEQEAPFDQKLEETYGGCVVEDTMYEGTPKLCREMCVVQEGRRIRSIHTTGGLFTCGTCGHVEEYYNEFVRHLSTHIDKELKTPFSGAKTNAKAGKKENGNTEKGSI